MLDVRDGEARTPLILAAIGGHGEVLNYLLAEGADLGEERCDWWMQVFSMAVDCG